MLLFNFCPINSARRRLNLALNGERDVYSTMRPFRDPKSTENRDGAIRRRDNKPRNGAAQSSIRKMHGRGELKARCQMGRKYNERQKRRVLARAANSDKSQ